MAFPAKYRPEFCEKAAQVLANGESLVAVCAEFEITRTTLYEWREIHPDFNHALQIGLQKAQRDWEALGRSGVQGDIDKFGSSAWIFTMKNRFRDDYQEDKEAKSDNTSLVEKLIDKLVDK